MIQKLLLIVTSLLVLSVTAFGAEDLQTVFAKINIMDKGPFDRNMLQGKSNRILVGGGFPSGSVLFQAAYRNEIGKTLAVEHDFYVGNLFTTNYYELMGEYVYGDANGNHALDHKGLLAKGAEALPKATSMLKHWGLERYFVTKFPDVRHSSSFKLRGISGSEFEVIYAAYFLNFYMTAQSDEFLFLPAFILLKDSPLGNSPSLDQARLLVAKSYADFTTRLGESNAMVRSLFKLRNAIHNQLSVDVINQIDKFYNDYPSYLKDGHTYLGKIRVILVNYYGVSVDKIIQISTSTIQPGVQFAALQIKTDNISTPDNLLALSQAAAQLKSDILDNSQIPYEKKSEALVLLAATTQFLSKEVSLLTELQSPKIASIILNTMFAEGFLIQDNWLEFSKTVAKAPNLKAALAHFGDILEIAQNTIEVSYSPALEQWVSVEPNMQSFVDDTIKSMSPSLASVLLERINQPQIKLGAK